MARSVENWVQEQVDLTVYGRLRPRIESTMEDPVGHDPAGFRSTKSTESKKLEAAAEQRKLSPRTVKGSGKSDRRELRSRPTKRKREESSQVATQQERESHADDAGSKKTETITPWRTMPRRKVKSSGKSDRQELDSRPTMCKKEKPAQQKHGGHLDGADPLHYLLWSNAWWHYKSDLTKSRVEITLNYCQAKCASGKGILGVRFHTPYDDTNKAMVYCFRANPVNKLSAVPGDDKLLDWSEFMPLRTEEHRKNHEDVVRSILVKTQYDFVGSQWLIKTENSGDNCPEGEELKTMVWPEFEMRVRETLNDEKLSKDDLKKRLLDLLDRGGAAYKESIGLTVQEAFLDGLKGAQGRDGVKSLLDHIINMVDRDKLRVKCHGSSYDDYGINMSVINRFSPANSDVDEASNSSCNTDGRSGGGDMTDEDTDHSSSNADVSSDVDDQSPFKLPKQGSMTSLSKGKRKKSSVSATTLRSGTNKRRNNADLTLFARHGVKAFPLLVIEIKSHTMYDMFQMQKHLLGGLLFNNEVFGLSINPQSAKIFRMKRDDLSKRIVFNCKSYSLDRNQVEPELYIFWDSDEFMALCDDLCRVLKYGIDQADMITRIS